MFSVPTAVLLLTSFSMIAPILQSVAPYRLRGLTFAVSSIYVFFIGATGGAAVSSLLDISFGPRTAILIVTIPSILIGGFLIIRSSKFVRNDLSLVVAELQEELEDHQRRAAEPDSIPVLQLNAIDFSYGNVQVLFDLAFEVKRGEVLALLGTNGAGKSTALRIAAGLETPSRGVVRLEGQTVTFTSPEQRSRLGIHLLPGGKGVFSEMTIAENLEMGAFAYRSDRADIRAPDRAGLHPVPGAGRTKDRAGRHALGRSAADAGAGRSACCTTRRSS